MPRASAGRRRWGMSGSWHAEWGASIVLSSKWAVGVVAEQGIRCCCSVVRSRSRASSANGAINPVPGKDAGSWATDDIIVVSMLAAGVGVQHPLVAFCWSCSQNLLESSVPSCTARQDALRFPCRAVVCCSNKAGVQLPLTQCCVLLADSGLSFPLRLHYYNTTGVG